MSRSNKPSKDGLHVLVSRRRFIERSALSVAAVGILSMRAQRSSAQAKQSKEETAYQETPKGDQQCSKCVFFIADQNQCQVVEGDILPEAWCNLYRPA